MNNKLYSIVTYVHSIVSNLQQETNHKQDETAIRPAESASHHDILVDDASSQHDLADWQNLYKREEQRFE